MTDPAAPAPASADEALRHSLEQIIDAGGEMAYVRASTVLRLLAALRDAHALREERDRLRDDAERLAEAATIAIANRSETDLSWVASTEPLRHALREYWAAQPEPAAGEREP